MNIRRFFVNMQKHTPSKEFIKGEKPQLVIRGKSLFHDIFIKHFLKLPEKTNVFHLNTNELILPIAFIGGREIRSVGDTCSMFYKLKTSGTPADYFFWDGIVIEDINMLGDIINNEKHTQNGKRLLKLIGGNPFNTIFTNGFGLVTGAANYRIVLIEKIPKNIPKRNESALKKRLGLPDS